MNLYWLKISIGCVLIALVSLCLALVAAVIGAITS